MERWALDDHLEVRVARLESVLAKIGDAVNQSLSSLGRSLIALQERVEQFATRLDAHTPDGLADRVSRLEANIHRLAVAEWTAEKWIEATKQLRQLALKDDHGGEPNDP